MIINPPALPGEKWKGYTVLYIKDERKNWTGFTGWTGYFLPFRKKLYPQVSQISQKIKVIEEAVELSWFNARKVILPKELNDKCFRKSRKHLSSWIYVNLRINRDCLSLFHPERVKTIILKILLILSKVFFHSAPFRGLHHTTSSTGGCWLSGWMSPRRSAMPS